MKAVLGEQNIFVQGGGGKKVWNDHLRPMALPPLIPLLYRKLPIILMKFYQILMIFFTFICSAIIESLFEQKYIKVVANDNFILFM